MAHDSSFGDQQRGLQHAASVIFALVAVVPLLVFAYTLHSLDVLQHAQAQAALGLALTVSLLGFWVFRSMLDRMSENVEALGKVVAQTQRAPGLTKTTAPPAPATRPAAPLGGGPPAASPPATDHHVPGVGAIREFGEMTRMMNQLWLREASSYRGRRVQVALANAPAPLVGTITDVTDEGFYLEQDGAVVAVSYGRLQSIDELEGGS